MTYNVFGGTLNLAQLNNAGEGAILGDFIPIEKHCDCLLQSLAISVLLFGRHLLQSVRWPHRSYGRNAYPLKHLGAEFFCDDVAFIELLRSFVINF